MGPILGLYQRRFFELLRISTTVAAAHCVDFVLAAGMPAVAVAASRAVPGARTAKLGGYLL